MQLLQIELEFVANFNDAASEGGSISEDDEGEYDELSEEQASAINKPGNNVGESSADRLLSLLNSNAINGGHCRIQPASKDQNRVAKIPLNGRDQKILRARRSDINMAIHDDNPARVALRAAAWDAFHTAFEWMERKVGILNKIMIVCSY